MKYYLVTEFKNCYVEYVVGADSVTQARAKAKVIDQDTVELPGGPTHIKTTKENGSYVDKIIIPAYNIYTHLGNKDLLETNTINMLDRDAVKLIFKNGKLLNVDVTTWQLHNNLGWQIWQSTVAKSNLIWKGEI